MRPTSLLAAALAAVLFLPAAALAQSGGTGLGIVLGEPTGVTARFMKGGNNFQVHAAWSFSDEAALQLNGDYLRSGRLETDPMMPFYFGLGVRVKFADDARLGVRVPLGVNHFFRGHPVEVFAEVVPILDLVPDTEFDFNGAVGLRWYFRQLR